MAENPFLSACFKAFSSSVLKFPAGERVADMTAEGFWLPKKQYEVIGKNEKKLFKRGTALLLSLLLVICSMPFVSFAAEEGISIKPNVTVQDGVQVEDGIEFQYYVEINNAPFNGTATGDDGQSYTVTDGILKMPYNVGVVLDNVEDGSYYSVKLLEYDNDKYALIEESEAQTGEFSGMRYFVAYDGGEPQPITAEQYNTATDNGANTTQTVYRDAEGNEYSSDQLTTVTAYDAARSENALGQASYSIAEKSYTYLTDSLETYHLKYTVDKSYSEKKQFGITTCTFSGNVGVEIQGFELGADVETTDKPADGVNLKKATARSTFVNNVKTSMTRLAYRILTENIAAATGNAAALAEDVTAQLPDPSMWSDSTETLNYETDAYSFKEVKEQTAVYTTEEVPVSKELVFDVEFAPAPTGSFTVDFMLYDGALPVAYEGATFEVYDMLGTPLVQGEDYTLEVSNSKIEIPLVGSFGFTQYKFSGLKHGSYSVAQTGSQDGYVVDHTKYSFEVSRASGEVTGDHFSKSSFGSYTALTNNNYSFITNYKVFKNNSISINFTKVDQNGEPVEGASFMLIERDALLQFVRDIAQAGIGSIGGIDIQSIIEQITSADWSNIDVGTILGLILSIVNLGDISDITIPAILTSKSNESGLVELNNSKNMLNMLGTITNSGITGAQLAEVLQQYFGSVIPEEYLPMLDSLAAMTGTINVHTGFRAGAYIMIESEAPFGYERNSLIYTFVLTNEGTAQVTAGVLFPVIVDALNSQFGIDLKEILVSEEEFEQVKDTIGGAFETFDQYAGTVIDNVVNFLGEIFGEENATANVLRRVKQQINDYYEQYDDLAAAIGQTVKDINSYITDEVTEDWKYIDNRYFVDINVNVSDCLGNQIDGATYSVNDSADSQVAWTVENKTVNVPFGDYSLNAEIPEGWQLVDPDAATAVTVNDKAGVYSFDLKYHHPKEPQNENYIEATNRGEEGGYDIVTRCSVCNEIISSEHVTIPAQGVDITVLGSNLGTTTLNGEPISSNLPMETKNVDYMSSYTLTAQPNEDAVFVGWYSNGKLITEESTYTTYAYADETYQPVFEEIHESTFHVTFVDMYGNVIAILDNDAVQSLEEMPPYPEYAGMKFTGWSHTLEEIKQMSDSAVVYAYYTSDTETSFNITADGCTITVDGEEFENSATAHYNSQVTVKSADGAFASWTVNGTVAAYSESYSFLCGSDVVIGHETGETEPTPVVASVSKTEKSGDFRVKFLATRFVPENYSLVESGFVYGKGMTEDDLKLTNVGTVQGTDGGTVKAIKNSNMAAEGQFALTYGVEKMDAEACARPYMIYEDSEGNPTLSYGDTLICNYAG